MPHPLLIVSQSDSLIQVVDSNSHTNLQIVQFAVFKGRLYPGSAGLGLNTGVSKHTNNKNEPESLLLEIDQSKELWYKSPLNVNGLWRNGIQLFRVATLPDLAELKTKTLQRNIRQTQCSGF